MFGPPIKGNEHPHDLLAYDPAPGLGDEFLRHIERTRVLVHMVDICPLEGDPVANYHAVRSELEQYSSALTAKAEIVVANKMDLTGSDERLAEFSKALDVPIVPISAVTGRGLEALGEVIWRKVTESIELEAEREPTRPVLGVPKTTGQSESDND